MLIRRFMAAVSSAAVSAALLVATPSPAVAAGPCDPGSNPIVCENSKPGTPRAQWDDVNGAGEDTLQGFATSFSVNKGETQSFKVRTDAAAYSIDIYRLGWYGGNGARLIGSVTPVPHSQPECLSDTATGLVDCGNWAVSASWTVPASAVSGVYIARLSDPATGDTSHITFVVRDDASHSDVVFQTSDSTWQAYNLFGGNSFYQGQPVGRAYKLSYNRPFATRGQSEGRDFLFSNEYPMLAFLERNGLDVSYIGSYDTDVRGALLTNHKVFVSTGHDEYWSKNQRQNVEAARDAGLNLAFFSGNEVYWKTRWEPSIDGTSTDGRTLTCYKETWAADKIDPSAEWTGTWRDPRFSPPSDGGKPENALTGTAYMSNNTDLAITVSAAEGKLRLWRDTNLTGLADGTNAALAPHTVGYESDEDLDNGFRPAGLIRLSTTTGPTPEYLQDYGLQVQPGTTTHHLTLYRAASGALVFGAGTIQWAWGLTQEHDGAGAPADPRIQQATLNILADMGALPRTTMIGLVTPTSTSDSTGPTTTITSSLPPSLPSGSQVTVTGTAADAAGRVGGVEVSLDGGTTWHPASGTTSWTYTGVLSGRGPAAVRARAIDDSANIGAVASQATVLECPCSLFGANTPTRPAVIDPGAVELGVKFTTSASGYVHGVRFYKGTGNNGTHVGSLWSSAGNLLARGTFTNESPTGWQTLTFDVPVAIDAGQTYVASYTAPSGNYAADAEFFMTQNWSAAPLTAAGRPSGVANGVYGAAGAFPSQSFKNTNYWVDVTFVGEDQTPPVVSSTTPLGGASSVSSGTPIAGTFARAVDPGTVALTVTGPGGPISGTTAYDAGMRTATFTPSTALARDASYTASLTATSTFGLPMAQPVTWTFRTVLPDPVEGLCPCRLFTDSATPAVIGQPDSGVELGVRFVPAVDGKVNGVSFYKGPTNTGAHTVSLWAADGSLLATAPATNESTTGWQYVLFASPVDVVAGQVYTASYRAPNGGYSYTLGDLGSPRGTAPLSTPGNAGVYTYGSGAPTTAVSTNYWVDVAFMAADAPPTLSARDPGVDATSVPISARVTASFSGYVTPASPTITVVDTVTGATVAGANGWSGSTRTATFEPSSALVAGRRYTATVSGATSYSGAAMQPITWSFRTSGVTACPCSLFASTATPATIDSGDASATNLGTRFSPTVDGSVTGLRFYKSAANTGTHVGSLWTASGLQLASVTFTNETASGWQSAVFDQPVPVTAGTTYVVSYLAPAGHYSATSGFFTQVWTNTPLVTPVGSNGVYAYGAAPAFPNQSFGATNYWVDPLFVVSGAPVDDPPTISNVVATPAPSAATVTWTTNEPATSVVRYGATPTVLDGTASGADGTSHSVSLSGLLDGASYWYRVESRDLGGNVTVWPALTDPPATFATPDTVAPVITAVTAVGSGTTATFSWTTNESGTTRVEYGLSVTTMTSSATGATGTVHTVTVNGLLPNTRYYYRVVSVDAAGNTTTDPTTGGRPRAYAPTVAPIVQTTTAHFTGTGGYRSVMGDGEITSTPATGQEWTASTLPSGYTSTLVAVGGGTTVSAGAARVTAARYRTNSTYFQPRSVEAGATLSAGQTLGWATTGYNGSYARFAVNSAGTLTASTYNGLFSSTSTTVQTGWNSAPARFRIEWESSTLRYYVNDALVATHSVVMFSSLAFTAYDPDLAGTPLALDWLRIAPYSASTTYTSGVVDAQASVAWTTLQVSHTLPAGTTLTVSVRSGNTATPDSTWTPYAAVDQTTWAIPRTSRYLQYRLVLSTSGGRFVTPVVDAVTIVYRVP